MTKVMDPICFGGNTYDHVWWLESLALEENVKPGETLKIERVGD